MKNKKKILWIAPFFNIYRFNLLKNYANSRIVELSIFAGNSDYFGKQNLKNFQSFFQLKLSKKIFGFYPASIFRFIQIVSKNRFNAVMMPIEKKFLILIIIVYFLKLFFGYKLISYNHPLRAKNLINKIFIKLIFAMYDKIIFYTEKSMLDSINQNLINIEKSSFANNTLFFHYPIQNSIIKNKKNNPITLLYIGRLRKNKKIEKLFDLFKDLSNWDTNIQLKIIGDGKMSKYVEEKQKIFPGIFWYGEINDENQIKKHMEESHLSVNLGLTGLSIVHSFYYGLPYVTLINSNHGPEIDYLIDNYNGIVGSDVAQVSKAIKDLMLNQERYKEMSLNATKTMEQISHIKWYKQMNDSIVSI